MQASLSNWLIISVFSENFEKCVYNVQNMACSRSGTLPTNDSKNNYKELITKIYEIVQNSLCVG